MGRSYEEAETDRVPDPGSRVLVPIPRPWYREILGGRRDLKRKGRS